MKNKRACQVKDNKPLWSANIGKGFYLQVTADVKNVGLIVVIETPKKTRYLIGKIVNAEFESSSINQVVLGSVNENAIEKGIEELKKWSIAREIMLM
jgi:hypothetical protein